MLYENATFEFRHDCSQLRLIAATESRSLSVFLCSCKLLQNFQLFQVAIRDVMPEATVTAFECRCFTTVLLGAGHIPEICVLVCV